jgi:hypothetical protein
MRIRRRAARHRDLESRLVWILGSPRSGSTWLLNLLAADSRVVTIDEPGIGVHLGVTISGIVGLRPMKVTAEHSRINDFRAEARDYFFSDRYQQVWHPLLRDLILGRMGAQMNDEAEDPADAIVVIKEPHGSQGADVLLSVLPHSRLIFLLRDGRDVVDSELDANRPGSWGISQLDGFEPPSLDRSAFIRDRAHAWLWKTEIVQRAFRDHAPELRLLVRYEELLSSAESVLTELTEWLGLDLSGEEIGDAARRLDFQRIAPEERGSGQFARAATPGLWKENLSSEEQELLESIIGAKLRECGYA